MLNTRQLEAFYWAARLGSFTAAAARINTTQSAISMRVRELERDLDAPLFDRRHRAAMLTPKGRELLAYAEQILRLSSEAREHVSREGYAPNTLRLGTAEVVSITWLPRLIHAIHARHPSIRIEIDEALTQELFDRLERGLLDLVLAPGRPKGSGFEATSIGSVDFAWMASPSLGLPKGRLGPRDLQHWPIIALAPESHHHAGIEQWFSAGGATCRRIATCKSIDVAAELAAAGLGLTFLPVRCYRGELDCAKLRIVETSPTTIWPVEFTAASPREGITPFVRHIAALAAETSDFDKDQGQKKARRPAASRTRQPEAGRSPATPQRGGIDAT